MCFSTWEGLFTTVDGWIYLSVSWMKGDTRWLVYFALYKKNWNQIGKRNFPGTSSGEIYQAVLYNRHEVTQEQHLQLAFYKRTQMSSEEQFSCSVQLGDRRDFCEKLRQCGLHQPSLCL